MINFLICFCNRFTIRYQYTYILRVTSIYQRLKNKGYERLSFVFLFCFVLGFFQIKSHLIAFIIYTLLHLHYETPFAEVDII